MTEKEEKKAAVPLTLIIHRNARENNFYYNLVYSRRLGLK